MTPDDTTPEDMLEATMRVLDRCTQALLDASYERCLTGGMSLERLERLRAAQIAEVADWREEAQLALRAKLAE